MTSEQTRKRVGIVVLGAVVGLALPCRAELVYYLPFDNGSVATLANYGSAGGTATVVNVSGSTPSATNDVYVNLGGTRSENFPMAANFQQSGRIDLPDSTNRFRFSASGQKMTIAFWLKWRGPDKHGDSRQGLVSTMTGDQKSGWAFSVLADGKLHVSLAGPGNRNSTNTTIVVTSNVWTHVALTYAYAGDPGFYINGTNVGLSMPYYGAKFTNNVQTIFMGNLDSQYLPVNGQLDDVALFDTQLTAGKIRALSTAPGVVLGLNLGIMNQLFNLYDDAAGTTTVALGNKLQTWKYATGFTGHASGDTWTDSTGVVYIQLDAANTGVKYVPYGTVISLF